MTKLTLKSLMSYVASNPFAFSDFTADEVADFASKQVATIEKQYARRAEKRADKRADEKADLAHAITEVLGSEPITLATLSALLADEGVTASVQKLAPLMKELAENGSVKRSAVDKRVAYSL